MQLQRSSFWASVVKVFSFVAIFAIMAMPAVAGAQIFGSEDLPAQFEAETETASQLIIRVLNILLGVVGLVAVLFLVWGGFKYITSAGEEGAIEAAKGTIINALIGIVVVLLAFALVRIVANAVLAGSGGI